MTDALQVFHFEEGKDNFESFSEDNSFTFWWASKLMEFLGYESWNSFNKAINKAMTTCNTLNVPIIDNFTQVERTIEGKTFFDWKLSRFACYLTAMNGDSKKPEVAKAQAYFVTIAGAVQHYIQEAEKVERLLTREEISERERSLSSVAYKAGVTQYWFFQNAGYRGMYNKNISQLKELRRIESKRSLLDFMGKDELAANLFRITQTELKIKGERVTGQARLEATAEQVGRKVRQTMLDISNVAPENLPKSQDITVVKKELKERSKAFKKLDAAKKKKKQ